MRLRTKSVAKVQQKLHICKGKGIFFAKSSVFTTFFDDYIGHSCLYEGNYISVKKEGHSPFAKKIPFPLHMVWRTRQYFRGEAVKPHRFAE